MTTKANLKIVGSLYMANPEGFKKLLKEANRVTQDGYELLAVLPVGAQLGCVFARTRQSESTPPPNSFFE